MLVCVRAGCVTCVSGRCCADETLRDGAPGHRTHVLQRTATGAQFLLSCSLCRLSHTTQAWLCFFVLSAAEVSMCLDNMSDIIKKSDALLYTPSINDIEENCIISSFSCYMLELEVIFFEQDIVENEDVDCIFHYKDALPSETHSASCQPCEAYALKNTTVFFNSLKALLEELTARWNS
ncbi:interleukin 15, like isoform X2 [Thalassophryne amazonica]|uniref:interleukin 15, like isoform X2 n=1 Tax=Thalassophryne amazonica TaxID=390379 RepID=UPI001470F09C|nr:interleukin 15, like isoform X2 [Thalassophryne amazonica]